MSTKYYEEDFPPWPKSLEKELRRHGETVDDVLEYGATEQIKSEYGRIPAAWTHTRVYYQHYGEEYGEWCVSVPRHPPSETKSVTRARLNALVAQILDSGSNPTPDEFREICAALLTAHRDLDEQEKALGLLRRAVGLLRPAVGMVHVAITPDDAEWLLKARWGADFEKELREKIRKARAEAKSEG